MQLESLLDTVLTVLPMVLILSAVVYLPAGVILTRRHGRTAWQRHAALYLFAAVCWYILYATLFFGGFRLYFSEYHLLNLVPFAWVRQTYAMGADKMLVQLVCNIIMFVPFSFMLAVAFARFRGWIWNPTLCAAVILCIETIQYFIGRSCDIDDFIMNMLGSAAGYGLFALANRAFADKRFWHRCLGAERNGVGMHG